MKPIVTVPAAVFLLYINCGICLIPSPGNLAGETPQTVDIGDLRLSGDAETESVRNPEIGIRHLLLKVKTGLSDNADVGAFFFTQHSQRPDSFDYDWQANRVYGFGITYKQTQDSRLRFFAWQSCMGIGFLEHWNYLHLDYTAIFGYEKRYVVPYCNIGVSAGCPLWVDEKNGDSFTHPRMTVAFSEYAGLKIPLSERFRILPSIYGECGLRQTTFTQFLLVNFYALLSGGEFFWVHSMNVSAGLSWTIPDLLHFRNTSD